MRFVKILVRSVFILPYFHLSWQDLVILALNNLLQLIGEKSIYKSSISNKKTQIDVLTVIATKVFKSDVSISGTKCNCHLMISDLKNKFTLSQDRSEKIQILTIPSNIWTSNRLAEEFDCSVYLAKKAKSIRDLRGVLSHNKVAVSTRKLDSQVEQLVSEFYISPHIARETPGTKDVVVIPKKKSSTGYKEKLQKHLMLVNINEAYALFKEKFPGVQVLLV